MPKFKFNKIKTTTDNYDLVEVHYQMIFSPVEFAGLSSLFPENKDNIIDFTISIDEDHCSYVNIDSKHSYELVFREIVFSNFDTQRIMNKLDKYIMKVTLNKKKSYCIKNYTGNISEMINKCKELNIDFDSLLKEAREAAEIKDILE